MLLWSRPKSWQLHLLCLIVCIFVDLSSANTLGVRVVFNRGIKDVTACSNQERTFVNEILKVAFTEQNSSLRASRKTSTGKAARNESVDCVELCKGFDPETCFVSLLCRDQMDAVSTNNNSQKEMLIDQTIAECRESKMKVIATLKREISSKKISGKCKSFVGGSMALSCVGSGQEKS